MQMVIITQDNEEKLIATVTQQDDKQSTTHSRNNKHVDAVATHADRRQRETKRRRQCGAEPGARKGEGTLLGGRRDAAVYLKTEVAL